MKKATLILFIFIPILTFGQQNLVADSSTYLTAIKNDLQVKWSKNRTINLVFHGHSVPSGYFRTPVVNTLGAYPHLVLKDIKQQYPYAVINTIVTAIGGENAERGAKRFDADVLSLKMDVLFIDYSLNDRNIGLERAYKAWDEMVKKALAKGVKVILLTPSPDTKVDFSNPDNELAKHAAQVRKLAAENNVGLADSYKAFEFLFSNKTEIEKYMSQTNHPNELGHALIATEIMKWFNFKAI